MSDVVIRPTIPADLDALADALVEVYATDGYPVEGVDDPGAWVELPDAVGQWTALLDGQPVGHVALMRPAPGDGAPSLLAVQDNVPVAQIAVLARLFVSPRARRRALAAGLLETVERSAKAAGLRVVLDVMIKDQAALDLYRTRGWRVLGKVDHSFGVDQREQALALAKPMN